MIGQLPPQAIVHILAFGVYSLAIEITGTHDSTHTISTDLAGHSLLMRI
jgi:hypothetical protein